MRAPVLGSVVIPAHNEAVVLRSCLDTLFEEVQPGELEVVVAANGCCDNTAEVARTSKHPVQVLDLPQPSKTAALRAADKVISAFPRIYLDADVRLSTSAVRRLLERLRSGPALAARPPVRFDTSLSSWPVARFYRARAQMPSVLGSLWGAGVYAVSACGRSRWAEFPDVIADDLWVDQRFARTEIEIVRSPPVLVTAPRRSRDLLRILQRTYRGQAELGADEPGRQPTTGAAVYDLVQLSQRGLDSLLDAVVYAAFVITARLMRRFTRGPVWERDDSSRVR